MAPPAVALVSRSTCAPCTRAQALAYAKKAVFKDAGKGGVATPVSPLKPQGVEPARLTCSSITHLDAPSVSYIAYMILDRDARGMTDFSSRQGKWWLFFQNMSTKLYRHNKTTDTHDREIDHFTKKGLQHRSGQVSRLGDLA